MKSGSGEGAALDCTALMGAFSRVLSTCVCFSTGCNRTEEAAAGKMGVKPRAKT